jgi:hypothetical protein
LLALLGAHHILHVNRIRVKKRREAKTISKTASNFFFVGTAAKWGEDGGRTLLGDNTGRGAVTLRPISF